MKGHQKNVGLRQLLFFLLILYGVFTFVPAVIYGIAQWQARPDNQQDTVSQTTSAAADIATQVAPTPQGTPLPASTAAPSTTPNPPAGFLDDAAVSITQQSDDSAPFRILDKATDEVLTVPIRDFLPAAVACEMPLTAPDEALKAQAVATYTYYIREQQAGKLKQADFTCNTENWLVYVTPAQLQARWGEDYDTNYGRLKTLTDAVYGELLTYQGEPICASYFSISAGSTEASENVWGGQMDYLQAVASPGDSLSDGYVSTRSFTSDEIQNLAETFYPDLSFDFTQSETDWFSEQTRSASGYTQTISLCGQTLKGTEVRNMLALPSTCFDVTYDGVYYTFTLRGYGHGVGMSQTGAIFMAGQGSTYEDILLHYYTGATLTRPSTDGN